MNNSMLIRKAVVNDVKGIFDILTHYAEKDLLLPRSLSEIYDHIRDYYVLKGRGQNDIVHGVCGLNVCWEGLGEIKSLAVDDNSRGFGYGLKLVNACIEEAHELGLNQLFTLTYIPDFFLKIGFKRVNKSILPHKIWADCLKCPKFPDCNETALIFSL